MTVKINLFFSLGSPWELPQLKITEECIATRLIEDFGVDNASTREKTGGLSFDWRTEKFSLSFYAMEWINDGPI